MKEKIALMAISGLANEEEKETLEMILKLCTGSQSKQEAYKKGLELRACHLQLVTIDDINLKDYKAKYGYFNNYPVIQLALDYFQMSNDMFFEKYHFNYVPRGKVFEEVQQLIAEIQVKKQAIKKMVTLVADSGMSQSVSIASGLGLIKDSDLTHLISQTHHDLFRGGAM